MIKAKTIIASEITKLYQEAVNDFSLEDRLTALRFHDKKAYFRAAVTLVMYAVNGNCPTKKGALKTSVYRDLIKTPLSWKEGLASLSILELRAPYISPSLARDFSLLSHSDKGKAINFSQWIKNYSRTEDDCDYATMTESGRRDLERAIIARKEIPLFSGNELHKRKLVIKNNLLFNVNGLPFSTANYGTNESGTGYGILVMTTDGSLYCFTHKNQELHHSSIAGGRAVLFAGEIKLIEGHIAGLTSKSGHYKPTKKLSQQFLKFLECQHIKHPPLRDFSPMGNKRNFSYSMKTLCDILTKNYKQYLANCLDNDTPITSDQNTLTPYRPLECTFPLVLPKSVKSQTVFAAKLSSIFEEKNPYNLNEDELAMCKENALTSSHRVFLDAISRKHAEIHFKNGMFVDIDHNLVNSLYCNRHYEEPFAYLIKQGGRLWMARAEPIIDSLSLSYGKPVEFSARVFIVNGKLKKILFDDCHYPTPNNIQEITNTYFYE